MRKNGSAVLSFGLISIPVGIYSSAESGATVSFNMLHDKCNTRLKQQYICPKDGEIVDRAHTVKGYEYVKDQYLVFTPEELKALEAEGSDTVDIAEYVPLDTVPREYLEGCYYLGADKGGDRAYALFAAALGETGRAAIGQYASRGKQRLVLVRAVNGTLVMEQLHYSEELRSIADVPAPSSIDLKPAEVALAKQLIAQGATDEFIPEKYKDTVRERQLEAIQQKLDGGTIEAPTAPAAVSKVFDLMESLKASLAQGAAA